LHITLGFLQVTTKHVLRRMIERLDPGLDDPLPIGYARMGDAELAAALRPQIDRAIAELARTELHSVAQREAHRSLRRQSRSGRGSLAAVFRAAELGQTSRLSRLVECKVETFDDRVDLVLPDRVLSFPLAAEVCLRTLCRANELSVNDLVGIDEPSRLVVARRLIREGAVQTVDRD
jgi:hypothetical protein